MQLFPGEEVNNNVSVVTNLGMVNQMQAKLGTYAHGPRDWFPANRSISLCQENVKHLTSRPYVVTVQPDGPRCLLYVDSKGQTFMENRARHFYLLDPERGVKFLSSDKRVLVDTVLDGYLVRKLTQDAGHPLTFVIHDAIRCDGVDLTGLDILERINHVQVYSYIISRIIIKLMF